MRSPSTGSGIGTQATFCTAGCARIKIFDFLGADFFAAAIDQIFLAPFDHVVPRRMAPHQIAGAVEAVGGKCSGVVFRHAEITAQRVRSAGEQFADFSRRDFVVVVVDQSHFIVRD